MAKFRPSKVKTNGIILIRQMSEKNETWEKLAYEFFDSFFKHVIPGSIAVFLYARPLANRAMTQGFVNGLMFLIAAWVAGEILDKISILPMKLIYWCKCLLCLL